MNFIDTTRGNSNVTYTWVHFMRNRMWAIYLLLLKQGRSNVLSPYTESESWKCLRAVFTNQFTNAEHAEVENSSHNGCSVGRLPECWGIFVTSLRPILSGVYWCNLEFQSCCFVWTTLHVSSLCIQGRADKSFALQRGFQLQSALRRQAKGTFTITRRPHKNGISS